MPRLSFCAVVSWALQTPISYRSVVHIWGQGGNLAPRLWQTRLRITRDLQQLAGSGSLGDVEEMTFTPEATTAARREHMPASQGLGWATGGL